MNPLTKLIKKSVKTRSFSTCLLALVNKKGLFIEQQIKVVKEYNHLQAYVYKESRDTLSRDIRKVKTVSYKP